MSKWKRTGIDYIPVPGEPYYPQGKPSEGEEVTILKEDAVSALVRDSENSIRLVPKNWLKR
jgi:hypothetical protein